MVMSVDAAVIAQYTFFHLGVFFFFFFFTYSETIDYQIYQL